jgi:hypothetical protein
MIMPLTTALKPIQTISILLFLKRPSMEKATYTRKYSMNMARDRPASGPSCTGAPILA